MICPKFLKDGRPADRKSEEQRAEFLLAQRNRAGSDGETERIVDDSADRSSHQTSSEIYSQY